MESRNKLTMCRLCLSENECFINIFQMNDWQGFVAAEVISDLLQFKVSETDCYPHVVCSTCLTKLTDFKLFKEFCQKSIVTYDKMFILSECLVMHQPKMDEESESLVSPHSSATVNPTPSNDEVISSDLTASGITVKVEPLENEVIEFRTSEYSSASVNHTSSNDEEISSGMTVKFDSLEDAGLGCSGLELCEEDPLKGASSDESDHDCSHLELFEQNHLGEASSEISFRIDSYVQFIAVDTVTHSHNLHCLEHRRPLCTSKGAVDGDLRNLITVDESIFEKSKNNSLSLEVEASSIETVERLEEQWMSPGESMHMAPLIQEDIDISMEVKKERGRKENEIGEEGEGRRVTAPEKGVEGERVGFECNHCGNVLMSKRNLIRHMRLHGFGHTYDCDVCGKAFQCNFSLTRHALIHKSYKPYKCTECSKCFSQNHHLKSHIRLHSGYKPYKCEECSKCFTENSELKRHMRRHTGSKPYKCAECSKCYSDNRNLKKHMRLHMDSKP